MEYVLIRLPFLKCGENSANYGQLRSFNPGLSEKRLNRPASACFTPKMPFSSGEADQMLAEMRSALETGAVNFLHGLDPGRELKDMSLREEMAALAVFTGKAAGLEDEIIRENILRQAQTLLLWRFAAEELDEEIRGLERRLLAQETSLRQILSAEDEGGEPVSQAGFPQLPWRQVLRNVAYFLPDNAAIFLEGQMARDISETFCFQPVADGLFSIGNIRGAYAALEELPGLLSARWRNRPLPQSFTVKRWWVISNER